MDGGNERAPLHRVAADDVDADLQAEQVGIGIPHRSRSERIEVGVRGEAKIGHVEIELVGGGHRPDSAWCLGLDAVTDRAAVVPPAQLVEVFGRRQGRIGAHVADLDGVGLRQPHHDTAVLKSRSAELESHDGGLALHESRSAGFRQMQFGSPGHAGIIDRLAVDRRREHRPPHVFGNPGQIQAGGLHRQLDPGGRGPELAAHTRGLLRGDPHPVRVGLRPCAPGQPNRRETGRAHVDIQRTAQGPAHQVGGLQIHVTPRALCARTASRTGAYPRGDRLDGGQRCRDPMAR